MIGVGEDPFPPLHQGKRPSVKGKRGLHRKLKTLRPAAQPVSPPISGILTQEKAASISPDCSLFLGIKSLICSSNMAVFLLLLILSLSIGSHLPPPPSLRTDDWERRPISATSSNQTVNGRRGLHRKLKTCSELTPSAGMPGTPFSRILT
ncbi:hypothetical protein CEXT_114671 [Caerostris extrusa]|uniref:Uncharacterized protein n=1 Tax=Caerostris extrusa TaxID=172846 RepID=A0AAV4X7A1_CAEEX|nr:hypothetical protein CEXT_114671 [Caerostris extrusa]